MFLSLPSLLRCPHPALLLALVGCAPGEISWGTGEDTLRTAMFQTEESDAGGAMTLVLSTGIFECDLPSESNSSSQEMAESDLYVAALREGSRHLVLSLYREADVDWVGIFEGDDEASLGSLGRTRTRLVNGQYAYVDEAELEEANGVLRSYAVTAGSYGWPLGEDGTVRLSDFADDTTRGTFDFREVHVSGTFRATRCPAGSTLFDLLATGNLMSATR